MSLNSRCNWRRTRRIFQLSSWSRWLPVPRTAASIAGGNHGMMFLRCITDGVSSALASEKGKDWMTKGNIIGLWLTEANVFHAFFINWSPLNYMSLNPVSGYFSLCKQRNYGLSVISQCLTKYHDEEYILQMALYVLWMFSNYSTFDSYLELPTTSIFPRTQLFFTDSQYFSSLNTVKLLLFDLDWCAKGSSRIKTNRHMKGLKHGGEITYLESIWTL